MDCLNTLIGLSQTDCACYDTPPDTTSDSGLYIDEARGFNLDLIKGNDCKDGNIWEILEKARTSAIQALEMDLRKCLLMDKSDRYSNCSGQFISSKLKGTASTNDFVAVKIDPHGIEGLQLNITKLGLLVSTAGTVNWFVYSSEDFTTPIASGSQAVVPSGMNLFDVDVCLDLGDKCEYYDYYIVIEKNGVATKSNQIWCRPCNGGEQCTSKFYGKCGISGNDINQIESWTNHGNYANGIIYVGDIVCDVDLCDYLVSKKNPMYMWIATALQLKAAEIAYYNVINSGDFSRFTTLNMDCLSGQLVDYKTWYEENINYICQELGKQNHPCLTCDSPIKRHTIVS